MPRRKVLSRVGTTLMLLIAWLPGYAVLQPFGKGMIVDVQQKSREKVQMYLVNTPVTMEVPYFQISVELGETTYTAEYTPRHPEEPLPDAWKNGETVQCRVDKHRLYLQRPDGTEMPWIISKKTSVDKNKSQD